VSYNDLLASGIPVDRINLSMSEGTFDAVLKFLEFNEKESNILRPCDVGIVGAGDFGVALALSLKESVNVIINDSVKNNNVFCELTRVSTNRSFFARFPSNIHFTSELHKVLEARFIILSVPANAIPEVIRRIKLEMPATYMEKQYVLVSKGFIGKGYIPHRWLQKNGIPFENIIWASGGNVARDVVEKKSLKMAVVSMNKNKAARREFASMLNREYLYPLEYSGSALLACELGGILKNYYAGFGRYILAKHGEAAFLNYKRMARSEFRRAVRFVSSSPTVSIRGWVIRKASHGPAFWEDLDVTSRDGRNGFFGEHVFNGGSVKKVLGDLGLVESFRTLFSTLSLFNRLSRRAFKRLPLLKKILDIYEQLHIEYLESGDSVISEESKEEVNDMEKVVLKYKRFWMV
jgi:glycerol-3-phosphate dehydrogenase